jgi:hypothetical protein
MSFNELYDVNNPPSTIQTNYTFKNIGINNINVTGNYYKNGVLLNLTGLSPGPSNTVLVTRSGVVTWVNNPIINTLTLGGPDTQTSIKSYIEYTNTATCTFTGGSETVTVNYMMYILNDFVNMKIVAFNFPTISGDSAGVLSFPLPALFPAIEGNVLNCPVDNDGAQVSGVVYVDRFTQTVNIYPNVISGSFMIPGNFTGNGQICGLPFDTGVTYITNIV